MVEPGMEGVAESEAALRSWRRKWSGQSSVAPFFAPRRALAAFAGLALFLALGAPFFGLAPFFEPPFSGATGAPCSATAATLSVVSALFM